MSNPGSVARFVPRRSATAVALLGGLTCLAAGHEHPILLVVGGVAVAIGLVTEVGRALLAVRAGRLRTFWIPFPVAALLVVAGLLMLGTDPQAALRRGRREYYLGPYSARSPLERS